MWPGEGLSYNSGIDTGDPVRSARSLVLVYLNTSSGAIPDEYRAGVGTDKERRKRQSSPLRPRTLTVTTPHVCICLSGLSVLKQY